MGGGGPGLGPGVTLSQDVPPREVIECKSSTLYPPPPGKPRHDSSRVLIISRLSNLFKVMLIINRFEEESRKD